MELERLALMTDASADQMSIVQASAYVKLARFASVGSVMAPDTPFPPYVTWPVQPKTVKLLAPGIVVAYDAIPGKTPPLGASGPKIGDDD